MELIVKQFEELSSLELYEILKARVAVFVVEQHCPYQEIDGKDPACVHVFYRENQQIQAYLRVVPPGISYKNASIGRVLTLQRGSGLGKELMLEGIRIAEELYDAQEIDIQAQSYARGFYEQCGFVQISEEFLEDDIPHINMRRTRPAQ